MPDTIRVSGALPNPAARCVRPPITTTRFTRLTSLLSLTAALMLGGCAAPVSHGLVPVPVSARVQGQQSFTLDTTAAIGVVAGDEDAIRVADWLAGLIGTTPTTTPRVLGPSDAGAASAAIQLVVNAGAAGRLGQEGYTLRVAEDGARIEAADAAGLFYGVQTLRQLMPPELEYDAVRPRPLTIPFAEVEDVPRFGWRGAMLDVSRHFFGVDDVKRYIDLMSMYKMNRLHLHLSDDQGWRIEIPAYPRLTEHGGSTEVGGGPGGFFTTDDYRELVRYAQDRFIIIVPEIDLPGHTNAALASVPELNCDGVAPELYTGTRVGFSTVCVDREETYEFIDSVVAHLARNTPGPWIHVGGDEVEELTEEEYVHFVERVETIVHSHGKRMAGWAEIAAADLDETTLYQQWQPGTLPLLQGAAAGQIILSPSAHIYVDMQYHEGTPLGLNWAGLAPLSDAYGWEPAEFVPGLPIESVVGLEAPLWAETVATIEDLEFMAYPRLAAVAELAWSQPELTEWSSFRRRVAQHGRRWIALGVNFYRSPEVDWTGW